MVKCFLCSGVSTQGSEYSGGSSLTSIDQSQNSIGITGNIISTQEGSLSEWPSHSTPSLISNEIFLSSVKSSPTTSEANGIFQYTLPTYTGNGTVTARSHVSQATTPTSRFNHRTYARPSQVNFGSEFVSLNDVQIEPNFATNYSTSGIDEIAEVNRKLQILTDQFKSTNLVYKSIIILIKFNPQEYLKRSTKSYCFLEFQEESLEKQEELKSEIRDLKSLLVKVLAATGKEANNCEALAKLPITTEEGFFELEEALKLNLNYQEIVSNAL